MGGRTMMNVYFQHQRDGFIYNIVATKRKSYTYFYVTDILNDHFNIYRVKNVNGFRHERFPSEEAIKNFVVTTPHIHNELWDYSCYEVVDGFRFKML